MSTSLRRLFPAVVAALVLACGLVAATPHPAKATAACWASDAINVPYTDWYAQGHNQVYDTNPGVWRDVYDDIQAYRYSGSDGNCYRGYYASVWTGDGSGCSCHARLYVYTAPGQLAAGWDNGTVWGSRQQVTDYAGSNTLTQGRAGDLTSYVTFPSGVSGNLDFYRSTTDQPRADNTTTDANSPTWGAHPTSQPGGSFYIGWGVH